MSIEARTVIRRYASPSAVDAHLKGARAINILGGWS